MQYQKEIQILRGLAVSLVVLFHLDLAGFRSGFLGVDVFFVISGYLMARMYDPTDIRGFYAKRARRLLPAYFAVVAATLVAAMIVTTPNDFGQVAEQGLFASVLASNIGFWLENSYFNKAAFKPLLHLWSLGVEIQFYLLVPLLVGLFNRFRATYLLALAGSLSLCMYVVGVSTKTAFFWLPFRLWEFLLGFGIARLALTGRADSFRRHPWIGTAGLLAIISIPLLPTNGEAIGFVNGHPGLMAVFICVATAAMLLAGLPGKLLANRVANGLERLGDYSYSIYLVHFPIIVLFLYQPFSGTILKADGFKQISAMAAAIAVATAMLYKFVEQPFRRRTPSLGVLVYAPAAILAISIGGATLQRAFVPATELAIYQAWTDRDTYRCGKLARLLNPLSITCQITPQLPQEAHRILLVGNSHADSIKATFATSAATRNISVYFMVENNPLMRDGITPENLIREAESLHAESIVPHYSPTSLSPDVIANTAKLAKERNIRLSYILPVPVWPQHIPKALWKNKRVASALPTQTLTDYRIANSALITAVAGIQIEGFRTYETADIFCKPNCRIISREGKPYYYDSGHLTLTGSMLLRNRIEALISDLY